MKPSFAFGLLSFLALLSYEPVEAETVRLKNGTVLNGAIVQMTETDLTIDTADMGQVVVKRRAIAGFSDDPTFGGGAPAAATAPAAPAIAINNNNNNAAAVTTPPAPMVPAPAAPAPKVEAAPTVAAVATAPEHVGYVLGKVASGVAFQRTDGGTWSAGAPLVHWDIFGYRWASGFGFALFGAATREQRLDRETESQWMQAGVRLDTTFGEHATRFGNGTFYAGIGAAQVAEKTKMRKHKMKMGEIDSAGESEMNGIGGVVTLGYQVLRDGGFGLDLGASGSRTEAKVKTTTRCDGRRNYSFSETCHYSGRRRFATAAVTLGATYAL